MATKILCIGAHNDEIMADMGGTAFTLNQKGCELLFLNLACQYNDDNLSEEEKLRYQKQELAAAKILGGKFLTIGNRDDLLFLESKEAVEATAKVILDFDPDIVFIHSPKDNHIEHREVAKTSYKALCVAWVRGARFSEVYSYQTGAMQSTEYFRPDFFVEVSDNMDAVKESLMQFDQNHANGAYLAKRYEMDRLCEGRGIGVEYAESFKIVKFPNGSGDFMLKKLLGPKFVWYGNGMYPAFGEAYF